MICLLLTLLTVLFLSDISSNFAEIDCPELPNCLYATYSLEPIEKLRLTDDDGRPLCTKFLFDFLVCSPNKANVIASIILDLPEPLSPTKIVVPLLNVNVVSLCEMKLCNFMSVIVHYHLHQSIMTTFFNIIVSFP
jgi:hypothetical protein